MLFVVDTYIDEEKGRGAYIEYVNKTYGVQLEQDLGKCEFSARNEQCIKERCPFYAG